MDDKQIEQSHKSHPQSYTWRAKNHANNARDGAENLHNSDYDLPFPYAVIAQIIASSVTAIVYAILAHKHDKVEDR